MIFFFDPRNSLYIFQVAKLRFILIHAEGFIPLFGELAEEVPHDLRSGGVPYLIRPAVLAELHAVMLHPNATVAATA